MTSPPDFADVDRLLEALTTAHGPTGHEGPVREVVRAELIPVVDAIETDALGSLIATLRGGAERPRIMLAAHMDELGLMVKRITDEGFVKFQPLGAWLDQAMINQRWLILTRNGPVPALTGIKTMHVMSAEARRSVFKRDDMFLDAGAASREDAERRLAIRPGDPVVPDSAFTPMAGGDLLLSKAWDDRIGVAVMIGVLKALSEDGGHANTVVGVATVQEEVGLRGAQTSAYTVEPDVGLSLEVGVAGDYPGITADETQERLGDGPAVFLHDRSMLPNLKLRDLVVDVAAAADIPLQFNVLTGYGEDGSAIQRSRGGAPAVNITVPARYLHSHDGIVSRGDYLRAVQLVTALVRRLDADTVAALTDFDAD
ncbi:MAG: M42 family metallopeptidase [Dehalococcoidia bacterium]